MSEGNQYNNDGAEKGRIVRLASGTDKLPKEEIENVFGYGREGSVWANPCTYEHLSDYHPFAPKDRTERAGFLAWDAAATQNLPPKEVVIGEGENKKSFYSICGYRDLLPHQHNFSNSSHMIKWLEEQLIDDLTFHIFGIAKRSIMNPYGATPKRIHNLVTGYTIRFDGLPVTPKDNLKDANTGLPPLLPTNRVARGRIYGAILVPKRLLDTAPAASSMEIMVDPRLTPLPEHKVIKPPPELPEFTEQEQEMISALVEPHGQFGLSPEKTRIEQLKLYEIGELELDPDLPIPNPQFSLSTKILKWRSELPIEDILESMVDGQVSQPLLKKAGTGDIEEDTWYISYLTGIDYGVHPDPEFLFYDPEHDQTVISAVRRIYMDSQVQPEIRALNPDTEEEEIIQPRAVIPKEPPTRDLFSLADSIGYYKTDSIPDAVYPGAQDCKNWIVTVGVTDKKLREAEKSNFGENSNLHYPPQNKFDWIPKVGMAPWRTIITMDNSHLMIPMETPAPDAGANEVISWTKKFHKRVIEKQALSKAVDIVWYVHESEWGYKALEFDIERQHRARQEAVAKLYSLLPDPRVPDWRVHDWDFEPMPYTDKAVILVGVRQSWIEMNPYADNASPQPVPPIATMPKMANAPAPMLNWRKTFAPFPTWYDSNREKYYGIVEAESWKQFHDKEKKKIDLNEAMEVLSAQAYEEIVSHFGKDPTPSPKIGTIQYFKYWTNRSDPYIQREIHIEPRPNSAPRVIVSIDKKLMDALPLSERQVPLEEIPTINENFIKNEKYLVLKIPTAHTKGLLSFQDRLEVAAGSLRKQAGALKGKQPPGGLTATDLRRASTFVSRFSDDFNRIIVGPSGVVPATHKAAVINSTRDETGAEFYMYLDPEDYSVIDVLAFNKTRLTAGISEFKKIWSPPNNVAMKFVFWAGATYIKTSSGRKDDGFDIGNLMSILTDPFGALGDLALGMPNIPGLPDGFMGKLLANEIDNIKKGAADPPQSGPQTPAMIAEQKMIQAALEKQMADRLEKSQGATIYNVNQDITNPSALHEDPNTFFDHLSAAGCGQDLFDNILQKVNLFNLLMLYLKCLGIELPIDLRCLFNFPWPLFDINLRLPWIFIPYMTLAGLWEIIRRIIFELLCQLITQLLMMMVKEILEAILRAGGCLNDESDSKPPMTEAPFDFGPISPKDLIDDALAGILDPLGGDQSPEDFANAIFNNCQPGLTMDGRNSSFGSNRNALTYLEDLKDVLTGLEWCALMKGEATNDVLDRVISFTRVNYPNLYLKQPKKAKSRADQKPEGGYIGWPRPAGARTAYRNFFMCIASFLASQLREHCSPKALRDKYGRPDLREQSLDDKCDFQAGALDPQTNLDDLIKAEYKKKGLSDDEIADLIDKAEKEAMNKMLELDNIQATINEFLEVIVPEVTAPVLDTIIMQQFDSIFRGIGIAFRGATTRIAYDMEDTNRDLQLMVNFIVNGRDVGVRDKWWTWRRYHLRRWWNWSYTQKYAFRWHLDEERKYWIPPDRGITDDKFKVKTQVWPNPDHPHWIQETTRYMTFPFPHKREYEQILHPWIKNQYKKTSHAGHSDLVDQHPSFAKHRTWYSLGLDEEPNFRTPRFYRNQKNLQFFQDYVLYNGTLGDVAPAFEHGKVKNDGLSSLLTVSNGKISFTVNLDKNGDNFEFDVYRDATTIQQYVNDVPDPSADNFFDINEATMEEIDVPKIQLLGAKGGEFGGPIKVDLSQTVTSVDKAGEEKVENKYPWWHNRKVVQSDGWIQKDEFMKRFIGDDHPLAKVMPLPVGTANVDLMNPENTGDMYDKIFQDLHDNWYVREVEESVIETIRRNPMENFWLEEYYLAQDWKDFSENKPVELMNRMRLFGFDDPYVKLADIRAKARDLMKDK